VGVQPKLRLFGEEVSFPDSGESPLAAVMELAFVYPADPAEGDSSLGAERDLPREREIERLLEAHGAISVEALTDCVLDFDSTANYLLTVTDPAHPGLDPAAHSACSFVAHAVPLLRNAGVDVRIDPSFPYPTLPPDVRVHALVVPDESVEWFEVRVGIDIDGKPYNIVPALLDLLEKAQEGSTFDSLSRYPARYRAIRLDNGRHVVLPWSRLERILAILSELYQDREGKNLRLPKARVQELVELDEAFQSGSQSLEWRAGAEWLEQARTRKRGPTWTPPPAALRANLRSYQHEGLSWLEHMRDVGAGAVLADDMGLGKTLQTIALLSREKEARRLDRPCLVVCPTSLVGNWLKELAKFAPHLRLLEYQGPKRAEKRPLFGRSDVIVTSYPIAIRDKTELLQLELHYLIIDEAQTIKNPSSQARQVLSGLKARHRLLLSGTPVENHLGELWSVLDFAVPGLLGSQAEFQRQFRVPIEDAGDATKLELLRKRVSPFLLRRTKESVARDLPPKTELTRAIELSRAERDLYESIRLAADSEVRAAIRSQGLLGSAITILDALMKLRQVCCHPHLLPVDKARDVKTSSKFEYFLRFTQEQLAEGRRVLVFSQFAKMLALLEDGLNSRGVKTLCLHGQSKNRQELVANFEAGHADVFLISLKAGGTGLNLVSADTVIHYDPWWNGAAQMQATDRAYRIGQKKPVFVYNLIAHGSVEERMLALQAKKRRLSEDLFTNGPTPHRLSEPELADLLSPLEPRDSESGDGETGATDASPVPAFASFT